MTEIAINASEIADEICERIYNVSVEAIHSGPRTPKICDARHTAWWLLREHGFTFQQIGEWYDRDHSTIIEGVNRLMRVRLTEFDLMASTVVCFNLFSEKYANQLK